MTATVTRIDDAYLRKAKRLKWLKDLARKAGRRDEANDYEGAAFKAERIAVDLRKLAWPFFDFRLGSI